MLVCRLKAMTSSLCIDVGIFCNFGVNVETHRTIKYAFSINLAILA